MSGLTRFPFRSLLSTSSLLIFRWELLQLLLKMDFSRFGHLDILQPLILPAQALEQAVPTGIRYCPPNPANRKDNRVPTVLN